MHWAEVEASELTEKPLIATGEAPSGPIHVGHIREILTGEAIARESGGDLVLIVDSIDPLRKLYPILDDSYEEYIGKPLSEIPCICGGHDNYAEHFMDPFLDSLRAIGVDMDIKYAHEMYAEGEYEEATRRVMNNRDKAAEIISSRTGRDLKDDWSPYNPKCSKCGKLGNSVVTDFEDPYVLYTCECGHEGKADIRKDDGKLSWRCDWAARWWILGIDCEPFGKDHAASGGSWDTGKEIVKQIFERDPPHPVVYEWIQLKGEGPMSSSSGVSISTEELLDMVEPEVVRFLIMRTKLNTHIDFDPGLGLLDLVDEYDKYEEEHFAGDDKDIKKIYELSQVDVLPDSKPQRIPYRHLVNLVQIYDDHEKIWDISQETGQVIDPTEKDFELMKERAKRVEYWLNNFAPDMVKFSIKQEIPDLELSSDEKKFLKEYHDSIDEIDWTSEELHRLVHENADKIGLNKGKAFRVFYRILLDQKRGPRLGRFLSQLEKEFVQKRLKKAIED